MKRYLKPILIGLAILSLGVILFWNNILQWAFKPNLEEIPTAPSQITEGVEPELVASGLNVPWEIAFLPDGDMLITERSGNIKRLGKNPKTFPISEVVAAGEGGLLGLALHPEFKKNNYLYVYLTTKDTVNRVDRFTFKDSTLSNRTTIFSSIPGAIYHNGGFIAFGPDGKLYITTGDARDEKLSQDLNSLAGKVLRINDDGSIPTDNPFGTAVHSYGHRNAQGLAWDGKNRLWATEHGRSGVKSGYDELNLIERGGNYGWPDVQGDETKTNMIPPVIHSGSDTTWAPADIVAVGNTIYFTGLRGQALFSAKLDNPKETLTPLYYQKYGRLRALTLHDGYLYFGTSNTDGRGTPKPQDDKIYRLKLQ